MDGQFVLGIAILIAAYFYWLFWIAKPKEEAHNEPCSQPRCDVCAPVAKWGFKTSVLKDMYERD